MHARLIGAVACATMRVLGVVWVTEHVAEEADRRVEASVRVPMEVIGPDFGWSRMPNSSQLEVFGPSHEEHRHFATGPVPEFLVEDLPVALEELREAGVEILGEPHVEGSDGWLHFRAPDGNVYGLTAAPTYHRPAE